MSEQRHRLEPTITVLTEKLQKLTARLGLMRDCPCGICERDLRHGKDKDIESLMDNIETSISILEQAR